MTENTDLALVADSSAYDADNPNSLQALLPENSFLPERITELADEINRGTTDDEFKKLLKHDKEYRTLRRLRLQFWNLYNIAVGSSVKRKTIPVNSIYAGIVSNVKFRSIMDNNLYAAFILTQPVKVRLIQEDLLYEGYRALEEMMEMDILKADGTVNDRIVGHKIKIIQMLEDRINGSVVQRVQQHIEQGSKFIGNPLDSAEDIEKLKLEVANMRKNLGKDIEYAKYTEIK